jgi:hypothetical protein
LCGEQVLGNGQIRQSFYKKKLKKDEKATTPVVEKDFLK